ncbi:unnamed protein product [Rotaria sp. Silwood2]|nr:unnamed protein product [Rotaria sp. Silwood2]CAF4049392.1 unnamed protein product [Rotaria sp. Silwood2]
MTTSNSSYDLIIIDCGPAGIAAALELQKYQSIPNFLIVEARNRVGGRTYTDTHTFDSNQPVDLGARWIHHIPSDKDYFSYDFIHPERTAFLTLIEHYYLIHYLVKQKESLKNYV